MIGSRILDTVSKILLFLLLFLTKLLSDKKQQVKQMRMGLVGFGVCFFFCFVNFGLINGFHKRAILVIPCAAPILQFSLKTVGKELQDHRMAWAGREL